MLRPASSPAAAKATALRNAELSAMPSASASENIRPAAAAAASRRQGAQGDARREPAGSFVNRAANHQMVTPLPPRSGRRGGRPHRPDADREHRRLRRCRTRDAGRRRGDAGAPQCHHRSAARPSRRAGAGSAGCPTFTRFREVSEKISANLYPVFQGKFVNDLERRRCRRRSVHRRLVRCPLGRGCARPRSPPSSKRSNSTTPRGRPRGRISEANDEHIAGDPGLGRGRA